MHENEITIARDLFVRHATLSTFRTQDGHLHLDKLGDLAQECFDAAMIFTAAEQAFREDLQEQVIEVPVAKPRGKKLPAEKLPAKKAPKKTMPEEEQLALEEALSNRDDDHLEDVASLDDLEDLVDDEG